ncbi:glycoside hydrolase family 31 protein [Paenibacillus segetis]|uniref:Glycosyl hydrolase family 31 n=1 Tax=Paenibacillus segetis TaxID=1325360 RepID=A0ABQ1YNZ2_9BACL|nr:glycoside hydrolase family 31 protein [Paenibacillus segetis]GGH31631.1 glycosyl hydrolase family 31 [Paenibacillus segetis]
MRIPLLDKELWYGGAVCHGIDQPYTATSKCEVRLHMNETPNQSMPLLLSSKGRYLWREDGFIVRFVGGAIECDVAVELASAEERTLRGAYLAAMKRHFPFAGGAPDSRFFSGPVYNTWIELIFHQSQQGVLKYAQDILDHGLPPGVLMIDDGWSSYYGRWSFDREKFPDAPGMLRQLHEMGFTIMVWVCPFITPDTLEYRALEERDLLVRTAEGEVHIARWWNGWSALLDLRKTEAAEWLRDRLGELEKIGVDGFKFDAGDSIYYPEDGDVQCAAWARFGTTYPLNEFRASWLAGGLPLMQRLCDKHPTWDERGLDALVPDAIIAGLTGHPYVCPDMIGGGEYQSFLQQDAVDEELFLRWSEVACLMPVMQFSAAPWRVLSPESFELVRQTVATRVHWQAYLDDALADCRATGEPVLRPLLYEFPEEECGSIMDTFMVGKRLLVAPLLKKGQTSRKVFLPAGKWQGWDGFVYSGGETEVLASPGVPLCFLRV